MSPLAYGVFHLLMFQFHFEKSNGPDHCVV